MVVLVVTELNICTPCNAAVVEAIHRLRSIKDDNEPENRKMQRGDRMQKLDQFGEPLESLESLVQGSFCIDTPRPCFFCNTV